MNNTDDKPIQYQRGYTEFYKLKFLLTSDVLIPRPETELLVDEVLKTIQSLKSNIDEKDILVLDIGTGSGNIAISIAKNTATVNIIATDVSEAALKIAEKNARFHNVSNRIKFIASNLLDFPIEDEFKALIIVTNLPYIPTERIDYLDSSVKDFEPRVALDGGQDGFDLYLKLFDQIKEKELNPDLLIGEIDYTHGEIGLTEAKKYFPDASAEIKTDLNHRQRILILHF